jgi:hypothetical protein
MTQKHKTNIQLNEKKAKIEGEMWIKITKMEVEN